MPTWACAKAGIYGRWYKKMKPNTMALTGIDSMPLPTSPTQGRTVLIRKHFLNFFFADMVFVIIHSAS